MTLAVEVKDLLWVEETGQRTWLLRLGTDFALPWEVHDTPEEGFLLSRIDGATPWSLLREISGLPAERVDDCLERWLGEGILELEGVAPEATTATAPRASPTQTTAVSAADLASASTTSR